MNTRISMNGALLLCLFLSLLLQWLAWKQPIAPTPTTRVFSLAAPANSPCGAALQQAWRWKTRARMAMIEAREKLDAWDPQAMTEDMDAWRQQWQAADPNGDLHRAREWARRAAILARTKRDRYRAAALLARIECELGYHQSELQYAKIQAALEPNKIETIDAMHHAMFCNKQERPAQLIHASGMS